jgi:hypothetical protein
MTASYEAGISAPAMRCVSVVFNDYRMESDFRIDLSDGRGFLLSIPRALAEEVPSELRTMGQVERAFRQVWDRLRAGRREPGGGIITSNQMRPEPSDTSLMEAMRRGMHGDGMAAQQAAMMQAQMQRDLAAYQSALQPAAHPAANSKSLALLKQWLSPNQLAQFEKGRFIEVTGSASGRRYRIKQAPSQNVYEIDRDGREIMGYCFGPEGAIAVGDVMLAQKIALETDELAAMKVANKFGPFGMAAAAYVRMRERFLPF